MPQSDEPQPTNPYHIGDSSYAAIARALASYDARTTIAAVAGHLTVPEYQPELFRIEMLVRLACLHCRGSKRPSSTDISKWLEGMLANTPAREMEDPPEDVFVSNVFGPAGNHLILEGLLEVNDYYLQEMLDCIGRSTLAVRDPDLWEPVIGLLRLSNAVVERSDLARWTVSSRTGPSDRFLRRRPKLAELIARVTFTWSDLADLRILPMTLAPFILQPAMRTRLQDEEWGNGHLDRFPVIRFADGIVFASPTSASMAVRQYVLEWLAGTGRMNAFSASLREKQRATVFERLLSHVAETTDRFLEGVPDDLPQPAVEIPIDAVVCAIDTDKVAHVVLLHGDPQTVLEEGIVSDEVLPHDAMQHLGDYLASSARHLREMAAGGLTVFVHGGLGRGLLLGLPEFPEGWHLVSLSLPDFETFAWSEDASLLRLWKLYEQVERVARDGVVIRALNGLLNLYAYWQHQGFQLVPPQVLYPAERTLIDTGTNHIQGIRARERVENDLHAVQLDPTSGFMGVRRFYRDAYFSALQLQPIYVAEEMAARGQLAGVLESRLLTLWVWAPRPESNSEAVGFLYQVWKALLGWLNRALPRLEVGLHATDLPPFHVHLSIQGEEEWEQFSTQAGEGDPALPVMEVDAENRVVNIGFPFAFLAYFRRPTNDAERILLELACDGVLQVLQNPGGEPTDVTASGIVESVMPGTDARSIHLFQAPNATDYLESAEEHPRFVKPEDRAVWTRGLARRVLGLSQSQEVQKIEGKDECTRLLNGLVDAIWKELRERLEQLDAVSLIRMALGNSEAISRDRENWKRTARALFAVHSEDDDVVAVAGARESDRSLANHAARVLVEMAVPTSPRQGGRPASLSDLDYLLAGIAILIELASDSDAIRGGVAEPRLRIHPNGMVESDHSFLGSVANPYVLDSFGVGFRSAAEGYERLYRQRSEEVGGEVGLYLEEASLVEAFSAEYGLTPSRVIDALAEFFDMAHEDGQLVFESTRGLVETRLRERRGFNEEEVGAFLRMLTLAPRERWDKAPSGFAMRDWLPWRYRRRLSLVARPIVVLGDDAEAPLLCGIHQLGTSISYLLDGIRSASLPTEFFTTEAMRSYRGSVAERLGHAFTEEVAEGLRSLGWEARTEVEMRELGAPKDLGDLDGVAWHPEDPRLLLVECKRLQQARGIGEIVERLNQFRGETLDRLGRHLRRVDWVEKNLALVRKRLRLPKETDKVTSLLVTNAEVPMQYKQDLALPPEQVVPVRLLPERLRPGAPDQVPGRAR